MADRIRRGSDFWEDISDPRRDRVVLEWIREGYKLEWSGKGCAPAKVFKNHPSAIDEQELVDGQVKQMLESGAIIKVYKRPKVVSPQGTVPKSSGKLRLILDMRAFCRAVGPKKTLVFYLT